MVWVWLVLLGLIKVAMIGRVRGGEGSYYNGGVHGYYFYLELHQYFLAPKTNG